MSRRDKKLSGTDPSAAQGRWAVQGVGRVSTHRWPRATVGHLAYGIVCECGNLKTEQALTCSDCAADRRRAPDHWDRRTCRCGGAKSKRAVMCRPCRNESFRGVPRRGRQQPDWHPWRAAETLRVAPYRRAA